MVVTRTILKQTSCQLDKEFNFQRNNPEPLNEQTNEWKKDYLATFLSMSILTSSEPQTICSSFCAVNRDRRGTGTIQPIPSRIAATWRSISCRRYWSARSTYSARLLKVSWILWPLGNIGTKLPSALCVSNDSIGMIWKQKIHHKRPTNNNQRLIGHQD